MTQPQREFRAQARLEDAGYETFLPFIRVRRWHKLPHRDARRVVWVVRPYWPRYLLAAVDPPQGGSTAHLARTDYINYVLSIGDDPFEIEPEVVETLKASADLDGFMGQTDTTRPPRLKPGTKFRFADTSPFMGLIATVKLDNGKQISVDLQIGSGFREISVPPSMVGEIVRV